MSHHMMHERRLLAKRKSLKKEAEKIYDKLDAIFFEITQVNKKIEEQRQKQQLVNTRQLQEPW